MITIKANVGYKQTLISLKKEDKALILTLYYLEPF